MRQHIGQGARGGRRTAAARPGARIACQGATAFHRRGPAEVERINDRAIKRGCIKVPACGTAHRRLRWRGQAAVTGGYGAGNAAGHGCGTGGNATLLNAALWYTALVNRSLLSAALWYTALVNPSLRDTTLLNPSLWSSTLLNTTLRDATLWDTAL